MTTTARATPIGRKMNDGYQTLLAFAADPDVSLWEKTVKPPGLDGGDPIDTTTMHNTDLRTFAARALKTLTESSLTCAYDARVYNQALSLINVPGWITVHFPDGDTLDFIGYLRTLEVTGEHSEGEQPEITANITPTNEDPTTGVETLPVWTAFGSGT